jgi:hypothetical protein
MLKRTRRWAVAVGTLAVAIAVPALSGTAQAQSEGCTNATLKGNYAFSVVDFTSPLVVVGIVRLTVRVVSHRLITAATALRPLARPTLLAVRPAATR